MLSTEEAEKIISKNVGLIGTEEIALQAALGRTLREDILADRDFPPFDRSTMDGIALSSTKVDDGQRDFKIAGTLPAGSPKATLENTSSCLEIMTGACLPDGADCVVPVEEIDIENGIATLKSGIHPKAGAAIHPQGSDKKKGSLLLKSGTTLGAKELAIAASVGKAQITVARIPRIVVISTGDELVPVEATPEPHQIRRSNDLALKAALQSSGFPDVETRHIPDDEAATQSQIATLLRDFDVIILAGGVSKGKFDYVPAALESNGVKKQFHGISQRPGKPLWFGTFRDNTRLAFGLPGNPVSCFICLHRYVIPALRKHAGSTPATSKTATLASSFQFKKPLTFFLPVRLEVQAHPLPFNTSGDLTSLAASTGFIELPKDRDNFEAGESFLYYEWH